MAVTLIGGCGPKESQSVATTAAPVGVTSSLCTPLGIGRLSLQQSRGSGRGHGQNSVSHFRRAAADVQSGAGELFDAQRVKADAGAHDVHYGINGAHFVKMNFFERHVVDAGFGFAKFCEDRGGAFAHLGCELRLLQDFEDRAERAMLLLVFGVDLDVGGGHAVLPDFFGGEFPAGDLQAAQFGAEEFHAAAGVHQGAKRHVTANARKTIKISEFHGMPPRELPALLESRWRRIDTNRRSVRVSNRRASRTRARSEMTSGPHPPPICMNIKIKGLQKFAFRK